MKWGKEGISKAEAERKRAEETLSESEAKYRSLFENMLDGSAHCKMLFDDQGHPVDFVYLDVNSAFGRLTGLKDVIGRKVTEVIPGIRESSPELFEIYGRVALTGEPEKFEMELKPLGIWLSISVYSTAKEYFVAVFDNITERKKAQIELKWAHDELELRVRERTAELDAKNAQLIALNRVYAVLSDVNQLIVRTHDRQVIFDGVCRIAVDRGLFKMAWVGLVDEAERAVMPVACYGCEADYLKNIRISTDPVPEGEGPTGVAVRTGRYFINNDTETNPAMLPWRDEALKRGYLSSAAFPFLSEGRVVGALTVYSAEPGFFDEDEVRLLDELAADISHSLWSMGQEERRKLAEQEAFELNEKLRSLVDEAAVGVYMLQGGRLIFANPSLAGMLGYKAEELAGLEDAMVLVHPDDREMVRGNVEGLLSGEADSVHLEYRLQRKDKTAFFVELYGSATYYKGRPSVIGTIMDITERKELERQKLDFYAMVTHDIKSPLTAILGYSDLILMAMQDKLDAELTDMIQLIQGSGNKLLRLVEDFLAISRTEAGKLVIRAVPEDLYLVLWEARQEVEGAVKEKGQTLRSELPDDLPKVVMDRKLVLRAASNLLRNAVNYTPAGGEIMLKAEKDGGFVVMSVSDSGPGIPKEEQPRVFDKYYRSPSVAGIEGSGLGLAIVKAVADAHGGRVELASDEGKGSTFRLILPLAAGPA